MMFHDSFKLITSTRDYMVFGDLHVNVVLITSKWIGLKLVDSCEMYDNVTSIRFLNLLSGS